MADSPVHSHWRETGMEVMSATTKPHYYILKQSYIGEGLWE